MLQFEEQKLRLTSAKDELDDLGEALGISSAKEEIAELEKQAAADGFGTILKILKRCSAKPASLKTRFRPMKAFLRRF